MAHYHLTVKSGKSGCGSAHSDYIEREGKYAKRGDLEFTESGNMPNFAKDDASTFWKMADEHERINGRPYTEIEFSLPRGLSEAQRLEVAREYVNNIVGDKHAYSFAIHNPIAKDGLENPHVHFMFSERTIDDRTKELEADQFFKRNGATKNRAFSSQAFVWEARKEWTRTANHFMERNGITERIDERSYKDRNIDLTSTNRKMFDQSYEMRRDLRDIQKENGDKIIDDPTIALRALTSNDSTFTERDLETFIFRHTDGEEQYTRAYNSVIQSDEFVKILGKENYTTKELLAIEQNIVERTQNANNSEPQELTAQQYYLNAKIIEQRTFNEEQERAFNKLSSNDQIVSVNGSAGTGKSYVLGALNEYYQADNKKVYGVALQGITAQSMQNDAGIKSSTIASFLIQHEKGNVSLNKDSVIVLDEAGMVGSRDFQKLLSITQDSGAKIRMVGDSQQLNAVSAGNAYSTIQEVLDKESQSSLVQIMRQRSEEMKSASMDLSKHDIESALNKYDQLGKLNEFDTQESAQIKTAYDWHNSEARSKMMLAYTNKDVQALNGYAREIMRRNGEIGEHDSYAQTYKGAVGFATNDKIVFKENNKDMGVLNGSRGTIYNITNDTKGNAKSLGVQLDDGRKVNVSLKDYDKLVHGYATTIHGSQGMTVEESHVLLSKNMNANLAYVALTRHRADVSINYSREEFDTKIKRNGVEISARENLATTIGKADVKTFTGKEIESETFKHFKDEFTIENRQTIADKYNLRTQNNDGKGIMGVGEPTIQKSLLGSIKSKWNDVTGKTAQAEAEAKAKALAKENKINKDLEARQNARNTVKSEVKAQEYEQIKAEREATMKARAEAKAIAERKMIESVTQKETERKAFKAELNSVSADERNRFQSEKAERFKGFYDRMGGKDNEVAQRLFVYMNDPKTDFHNRKTKDLLDEFSGVELNRNNALPFQERHEKNAELYMATARIGYDIPQDHATSDFNYKIIAERYIMDDQQKKYGGVTTEDKVVNEHEEIQAQMAERTAERQKAVEDYNKQMEAVKEANKGHERIFSNDDSVRLSQLDDRPSDAPRMTMEEVQERSDLRAKQHQQDLIDEDRDLKGGGNDFISTPETKARAERMAEYQKEVNEKLTDATKEYKAELRAEMNGEHDKSNDKLKDRDDDKSVQDAKEETQDKDKQLNDFMEKHGLKGSQMTDAQRKEADDRINAFMDKHNNDKDNRTPEQRKEDEARLDQFMEKHDMKQSQDKVDDKSQKQDQQQQQTQEDEWDMDR